MVLSNNRQMSKVIAVIGAQWGDEGKGKIVDLLAEQFDIVVRYQGGHNAGHSVQVGDKSFVLHCHSQKNGERIYLFHLLMLFKCEQ